jgi:peptidoglycan/xylan/chitin deacetylase (PgdA/CDA1 family)
MKGSLRIKNLFRRVRRRFERGAVILAYHRVDDLANDPFNLAVSPINFAQHIDYLNRSCSIINLHELSEALQKRELPPRAVAITFDDGYLDFFEEAFPILKVSQVPATVFIPSGLVGMEREFWWDELERVFYSSQKLPEHLNLLIRGQTYHWDKASTENGKSIFWTIYRIIKQLDHEERNRVLNELVKWAGLEVNCRPGFRPMNIDELKYLLKEGLIEIGAHTITHATLSSLPEDEQGNEIIGGRKMLVDLLGRPVFNFAYPYGELEDFNSQSVGIIQAAGFSLAVTMKTGCNEPGDDLLRLKRCAVGNWPLDKFKYQIDSFFIS